LPSAEDGTRQKKYFTKKKKIFAKCCRMGTWQRKYVEKKTLPSAREGRLSKENIKKEKNLCQVPHGALDKENISQKRKNLCRVSVNGHLAKKILKK
jgi:hypothetical protein